MSRELIIGDKGTYTDWGLYLQPGWALEAAAPKTKYVEVPGASGALDYSEYPVGAQYSDRQLTASFYLLPPTDEWEGRRQEIVAHCHGRRLRIVLPDSAWGYLNARVSVGALKINKAVATLSITARCEPWIYTSEMCDVTHIIDDAGEVMPHYVNGGVKEAVPTWRATDDVMLTAGSDSYALAAGQDTRFPGLRFAAGGTWVTIEGAPGTSVTTTWWEAVL
jgi:hypothetical protein